MLNKIPKWLWIVIGLFVFGLIRMPIESSLRRDLTEAEWLLEPPGFTAMEKLGQSTLMGTLGGLRSLVVSFLVLDSFTHFENARWDDLKRSLTLATYLEPDNESHWVSLVWHRGINAPASAERDFDMPELEKELRIKEYALDAIDIGKAGLNQLPESVELRKQLSEVYRVKLEDNANAAEMYRQIIPLDGAPPYAERFYGYYLFDSAQYQKAYDQLIKLYWEGEKNHKPTLLSNIDTLQEALNIPYPQRIAATPPKRKRIRLRTLPGGIRIP